MPKRRLIKPTICMQHNAIEARVRKIQLRFRESEDLAFAGDLYVMINEVRRMGERMEERLEQYRQAIQDLGFKRVYKRKK